MYNKIVAEQEMQRAIESAVIFTKSMKMVITEEQAVCLIRNYFDGKETLWVCFTEEEIAENAKQVLSLI